MAEQRYFWLKLKKDFFDSLAMKKLRKVAGGDTFTICYLKLLLYTIDKGGMYQYQGLEPTISEELAELINEEPDNVGLTLNYLQSVGLAECSNVAALFPEAIENVGSEGSSAKRMRDMRERQKGESVTLLRREEIDKELDTDIEKNIVVPKVTTQPKRFVKPSLEEVNAYCNERHNNVDPAKFVDYYTANGWKVGKNPMKDWKAAIRTWEKNSGYSAGRAARKEVLPAYMAEKKEASPDRDKPLSPEELEKWKAELKEAKRKYNAGNIS